METSGRVAESRLIEVTSSISFYLSFRLTIYSFPSYYLSDIAQAGTTRSKS
jgi:hypothetical protein